MDGKLSLGSGNNIGLVMIVFGQNRAFFFIFSFSSKQCIYRDLLLQEPEKIPIVSYIGCSHFSEAVNSHA